MIIGCRGYRWSVYLAILTASVVAGALAHAALRRANWQLEGYLGHAPANTEAQARLILQYKGKDYEFDLTKAVPSTQHLSLNQLLHDLKSHQNKLLVQGPAAAVHALTTAAPGQRLIIIGYYRAGSGVLQEAIVSAPAPDSPPPAR